MTPPFSFRNHAFPRFSRLASQCLCIRVEPQDLPLVATSEDFENPSLLLAVDLSLPSFYRCCLLIIDIT